MKNYILLSAVGVGLLLTSCSSVYRTAQTPDDVYFSEGPAIAQVETRQDTRRQADQGYSSYWEDQDDNLLRMKVRDRNRWGGLDDIDYWQGYNNGFWVGYNTFNSPWGWNNMGFNSWNNWGHPMMGFNSWNRPFGMNNFGWNGGWGFNSGFAMGWNGFGMGMNSFGMGWNSWNNNWNNPWGWNRPITIINKYPAGTGINPSRSASAVAPYRNNGFSRGNTIAPSRSSSGATTRSIWENPGMSTPTTNRSGSMYRSVERVGGGVDGGNRSFDRPVRTFSGSSGGGTINSGGGSSGGSSSGSSSRGGRGG